MTFDPVTFGQFDLGKYSYRTADLRGDVETPSYFNQARGLGIGVGSVIYASVAIGVGAEARQLVVTQTDPIVLTRAATDVDVARAGLRDPNLGATLGDSLAAAYHADSQRRNTSTRSPLAWANLLTGNRLKMVSDSGGNFGYSGDRTDQIMARLPACIASGAGTVILIAGTNDVGQLYPTQATCAATAAGNIAIMARALVAAGAQVVLELPPGSANYTATQIGILNELNQRLIEFALSTPRVYLHDASRMVLNPINSTTALAWKANYNYDLTHPQGLGAYYWGKSMGALLAQIVPPYPRLGHLNVADVQPNAYLSNALLTAQSGGTNSAGAGLTSGAVPANFELGRGGSATVAITYGTDDGAPLDPSMGSKAILAINFAAAGDRIYLRQTISTALWNPGDIFDFGCRMRLVSGAGAVAGMRMFVPVSLDGVELGYYSMVEAASSEYGPDESCTADHVIGPVTVQAGTAKNWIVPRAEISARTAGAVVVEVSRFTTRRRMAA